MGVGKGVTEGIGVLGTLVIVGMEVGMRVGVGGGGSKEIGLQVASRSKPNLSNFRIFTPMALRRTIPMAMRKTPPRAE